MYDTVEGGGSAAAVVTHRLASKSGRKILLLEAGMDALPGNEPPEPSSRSRRRGDATLQGK
jgi:choline dehydrogenase-like flavoprotein